MKFNLSLFLLAFCLIGKAQTPTQSVTGKVIDKTTRQPLIGATVMVAESNPPLGGVTDINGQYIINNVPVGRRVFVCQYVGYTKSTSDGVIINSAQPSQVDFELIENVMMDDKVVITAFKNADEPVNDLSVVSARSFSPEETERFAASVNDPSRMALSFPGVQQGADDNENDIIIRGNSSIGMLWRLEGIDIPNPNHFARPGTSGGGITVFSAQLLNRSDFSSGAMPAEYGNALSGAFDVNFRTGNLNDRYYRAKVGVLGLDFMAEGPIKQGKSSYLANYRYSTLGLLTGMGVYVVGERVTNKFQDLSFNLNFQGKSSKDFFTVFGIGGLSEEHYMPVENPVDRVPGESRDWLNSLRNHNMGAAGFTYTRLINEDSYFKAVGAIMGSDIQYKDDTLDLNNIPFRFSTEIYKDWRLATAISYTRRFGAFTSFKTGLHINQIFYDYYSKNLPRSSGEIDPNVQYGLLIDGKDNTQTIQYYAQVSHQVSPKLTLNAGAHLLGLTLTNSWAVDPRVSARFQFNENNSFSLAYGLHSQIVPLGTFFYTDSLGNRPNNNLDLMRAHHLIAGYRLALENAWKVSLEAYYQHLFNVPVEPDITSTFWLLNNQSGFASFELESSGTGTNYGLDLVLEKSFNKGFFLLITASLFESKYEARAPIEFNSKFSTKFSTSGSIGKEITIRDKNTLQFGGRVLFNGGFRYTPHDPVKSADEGKYVPLEGAAWEGQVPPYLRVDARISYRMNGRKIASILSLDIQNLTNRANPRAALYNPVTNDLDFDYHSSGLVPILSYQIDF